MGMCLVHVPWVELTPAPYYTLVDTITFCSHGDCIGKASAERCKHFVLRRRISNMLRSLSWAEHGLIALRVRIDTFLVNFTLEVKMTNSFFSLQAHFYFKCRLQTSQKCCCVTQVTSFTYRSITRTLDSSRSNACRLRFFSIRSEKPSHSTQPSAIRFFDTHSTASS